MARNDWESRQWWKRAGRYNGGRSLYLEVIRRAEYFAWCARKGFPPVGNDPMSGRSYSIHDAAARELGQSMNMAAARMYLKIARDKRAGMGV